MSNNGRPRVFSKAEGLVLPVPLVLSKAEGSAAEGRMSKMLFPANEFCPANPDSLEAVRSLSRQRRGTRSTRPNGRSPKVNP
jgi:hypothetical protein